MLHERLKSRTGHFFDPSLLKSQLDTLEEPGPDEAIEVSIELTPEQIVDGVLQEDADVVGLSILSGAHMHICPRVVELLKARGLDDVLVLIGGIIPDVDVPKLHEVGVKGVFLPGTPMQAIVDFIHANVRTRS